MLHVLTYHRVAEPGDRPLLDPSRISATPEEFARQMEYLAQRCHAVSLQEVLRAGRTKTPLPPRSVLITFDDAYRDFAEHAWPVLRRHGLPVVLFVPTAYPGEPARQFWWDRLFAAVACTTRMRLSVPGLGVFPMGDRDERLASLLSMQRQISLLPHEVAMGFVDNLCDELCRVVTNERSTLSWDELRALADQGLTLAPHTRTHPRLTRVSDAQARQEILGSLADLIREVGSTPPVFSYPDGDCNERIVDIAKEAGVEAAFTTRSGGNDFRAADLLRLRRTCVTRSTSLLRLRFQFLPLGNYLEHWRAGHAGMAAN